MANVRYRSILCGFFAQRHGNLLATESDISVFIGNPLLAFFAVFVQGIYLF